MAEYRLHTPDRGLYEHRRDEHGVGYWVRVATYPNHLKSLDAIVRWYLEEDEEF